MDELEKAIEEGGFTKENLIRFLRLSKHTKYGSVTVNKYAGRVTDVDIRTNKRFSQQSVPTTVDTEVEDSQSE